MKDLALINGAAVALMLRYCDKLIEETSECGAQAREADRRMHELVDAGKIAEAEEFGVSELARLQLRYVNMGVEFEHHAFQALLMKRDPSESLMDFAGRVEQRISALLETP